MVIVLTKMIIFTLLRMLSIYYLLEMTVPTPLRTFGRYISTNFRLPFCTGSLYNASACSKLLHSTNQSIYRTRIPRERS